MDFTVSEVFSPSSTVCSIFKLKKKKMDVTLTITNDVYGSIQIPVNENTTLGNLKYEIAQEYSLIEDYIDLQSEGITIPKSSTIWVHGIKPDSQIEWIISNKGFAVRMLGGVPTISKFRKYMTDTDTGDDIILYLDAGICINSFTCCSKSILYICSERRMASTVKRLVQYNGVNLNIAGVKELDTPLHIASTKGFIDIVRVLVDAGASLLVENRLGWTPFQVAVQCRNRALAEYFLSVSGQTFNSSGETPFFTACAVGDENIYSDMVKFGISDDLMAKQSTATGQTPLHAAAKSGSIYIIKDITKRIPATDIRDNDGRLPLHSGVGSGELDVVKFLSKDGTININAADFNGHTPLHFAVSGGYIHIVMYLMRAGGNLKSDKGVPRSISDVYRNIDLTERCKNT